MQKTEDVYATYKLTDEDLAEIHALARDPKIGARAIGCSMRLCPRDSAFCHAIKRGIPLMPACANQGSASLDPSHPPSTATATSRRASPLPCLAARSAMLLRHSVDA